ncbi:Ski complex protein [Malassezia pachydermatis]
MHADSLTTAQELLRLCEERDEDEIHTTFQKQKGTMEAIKMGVGAYKELVVMQVLLRSSVAELFEVILAHPYADDELRRATEAKQLRYYHRLALAMPKRGPHADTLLHKQLRDKTKELAQGMVVLHVPDELAWRIHLEWIDASLAALPYDTLRQYVALFPSSGRAYSFRALLRLVDDEAYLRDVKEHEEQLAEETDLLQLAMDGMERNKDSTLCARIAGLFFLLDKDYGSALDTLVQAHTLVRDREKALNITLYKTDLELSTQLATAYTHLHAPKHHKEALELLGHVLTKQARNIDALLAQAYIQAHRRQWAAARDGFQQVKTQPVNLAPSHGRRLAALALCADYHMEAEAEYGRVLIELNDLDRARATLTGLLERCDHDANVFGAEFRARVWHQLGRCLWAMGGEYRTSPAHAYKCFIESIRRFGTYAPAFTSLGVYYESAVTPSDVVRASKCFQRAFELDASEYEAGRHLVEHFAAQREWGLVDVIARRVAEAEGGTDVLSGKATAAHVTQNPWVWKAIGMVEAQQQHADAAIAAFQVSLRASPRDADAWVRLGEAYVASGRPVAALKTYARALALMETSPVQEQWHVYYNMAEAQRRLGRYELALSLLEQVLRMAPTQYGVCVVLAETYLAQARQLLASGYSFRAVEALHCAITQAAQALESDKLLRTAWKAAADACYLLSKIDSLPADDAPDAPASSMASMLANLVLLLGQQDLDARLQGISVVQASHMSRAASTHTGTLYPHEYLEHAALMYKFLALVHAMDEHASVLAWADLATALCRLAWVLPLPSTLARMGDVPMDAVERRASLARTQAMECTHLALSSKPHARLWVLLGNLYFSHDAAMAQHAYIMAIEANGKSPVPWTNLGFLYLQAGDLALAEEAFVRAQTIAPDWPASRLGAALVHRLHQNSDTRLSTRLLEQAYTLSDGALLEADYGFALALWERVGQGAHVPSVRMMPAMLALQHYMARMPHDDAAWHLSALLAEQLGGAALAAQRIERASTVLEAEYEATESTSSAIRYGLASTNLGRIRLANGDIDGAIEAWEAANALLEEEAEEAHTPSAAATRVWCAIGLAHAHFLQGEYDASVQGMREILAALPASEVRDSERPSMHACAAVLLARMLWHMQAPVTEAASVLDHALTIAPQNALLITTRAALAAVQGDVPQYNAILAQYVTPLPPDIQSSLRNAAKTSVLSMLHLAAAFDTQTLVQYLASSFTRADHTTHTRVLVGQTMLRLAASCYLQGKPLPALPMPEGQDGSLLAIARTILHTVESQADEQGAAHWATAQWLVGLAEFLASQSEAGSAPAPTPAASLDAARRHATNAVHLQPWHRVHWDALRATMHA